VDREGKAVDQAKAEEQVAPHARRLRLRAVRDRLRESLLYVPVLLLIAALIVEVLAARIDRNVDLGPVEALNMAPDTAVTLLSTIAGATITTAGVVFSLLVVTLQLASGQFSPRVLRTFWRDRFGHVLVGLLLATFAFCVLALTQIDTSAEDAPTLTLAVAVVLAFASILAIVVYLNRLTRLQYVGRILEDIQGETLLLVSDLPYGSRVGVRPGAPGDPSEYGPAELARLGEPLHVPAGHNGWVQQISRRAVLAAVPAPSVVRLETRVGAYLVAGEPLATVWPKPPAGEVAGIVELIRDAAVIGHTRTMQQDIDFGIRQVCDIALRALSPAVNDPTTAIEVVLRLSSMMRPLLVAELPAQCHTDADGRTLLTPWELDHREYVTHAFGQLRIYAAPHPQVSVALVRSLRMLRGVAQSAGHSDAVEALDHQLELTLAGCARAGLSAADLDVVRDAAGVPVS
jgi:uncharacterized membrane protein